MAEPLMVRAACESLSQRRCPMCNQPVGRHGRWSECAPCRRRWLLSGQSLTERVAFDTKMRGRLNRTRPPQPHKVVRMNGEVVEVQHNRVFPKDSMWWEFGPWSV